MIHAKFGNTERDPALEELDRAHQEFLADIVHLDGKTAQRLFKSIAELDEDATTASADGRQQTESVR